MGKLTSLATILKGNHVLTKLIVWHGELKKSAYATLRNQYGKSEREIQARFKFKIGSP